MKLIRFFHAGRAWHRRTARERERFQGTMPGETGALAALRLGMLVG